ncbi:hypothetical protein BHYA_0520g00030 [Botrytis hyacinthi]|uniref:Uncharacterized protein n=1 Tax=Botrytis hyacinthi TaxID=278943 RepID=A0A4Z1G6H7_9HELO|nr:hypothetical protein BHYA_0520g00030 [Botrytis hyacinthi]
MATLRDPKPELYQSIFCTFPQLKRYSIADLYEQHPTKQGYWAYLGRANDIIALSSNEKANPSAFDKIVATHAAVTTAIPSYRTKGVSCDQGRKVPRFSFIDTLWLTIEATNRDCPAHARVLRIFIVIASPDEPLSRAGKETIQRASVPVLYAQEFEKLCSGKLAIDI